MFYVELGEPISEYQNKTGSGKSDDEGYTDYNDAGKPRLGDVHKMEIHIKESKVIKGIVDKLLNKSNATSIIVGTSSWKEQFIDALKVNAGMLTFCKFLILVK